MAEKGGMGFPIARKKVAFKSRPAAFNKQASTSMERRDSPTQDGPVEIDSDSDSEGFVNGGIGNSSLGKASSLKANGKTSSTSAGKVDSGKGGKTASGGKGVLFPSSFKPPEAEVDLKLELDIPNDARILMDGEAASILQGINDSVSVLSDDPDIKMPDSFNKALEYCKACNGYTDIESARKILESLKEYGVTDGEICMIGNVCPETIDEVYALIPSLKSNRYKNEAPIKDALHKLSSFVHV